MKTPTEFELKQLMHAFGQEMKNRPSIKVERPTVEASTASAARIKQRTQLATTIRNLEQKLKKLQDLIEKREQAQAALNHTALAKKERAAKAKLKPQTAAEKAKIDRDNKKYRDRNKQKPKTAPKAEGTELSVSELRTLATEVIGQIAIAKQKLAAL